MPIFEQVKTKFKSATINMELVTYIDTEIEDMHMRYRVHFSGGDYVAFRVDDPSESLGLFIETYASNLKK